MTPTPDPETAAVRYNAALRHAQTRQRPLDYPAPAPTAHWPAENVALLERYREWLLGGGHSHNTSAQLYIPMAGHALGLNLKPHPQLDLETDLQRALDYIKAKHLSAEWTDMCRLALEKFRTFLRQERGCVVVTLPDVEHTYYSAGLPVWLIQQLARYQHVLQRNWRPARLPESIRRFWSTHTRVWRWLCAQHPCDAPADVQRRDIFAYIDQRLAAGYAASGINQDLRYFQAFLRFLQQQDFAVPQALLRLRGLKEAQRLPHFLTDAQVHSLRDDFERQVAQAANAAQRRDALLDRAAFYLLWHGGLRLGEVEELRLEDLDLPERRLTVRRGKGLRDRTVYLTTTATRALQAYLDARGLGSADHVFLHRNAPLYKDLVRDRIKAAGARVGVKVSPHRLRHTFATQLVNAGCTITTIQKLLGHQRINSTLIYARVHDCTVAEDYYTAMTIVEQRLALPALDAIELAPEPAKVTPDENVNVLLAQLRAPRLDLEARLALVARLHTALQESIPERRMVIQ